MKRLLSLFNRQATIANNLSMEDIRHVNDDILRYLADLPLEEIRRRLSRYVVEHLESEGNISKAISILNDSGIVIVPNFLEAQLVEAACSELDCLVSSVREDSDSVLYLEGSSGKSYRDLAGAKKTIVQRRTGQDEGMIDVFNWDLYGGAAVKQIRSAMESSSVLRLVRSREPSVLPANMNAYVNSGVPMTRGFHVDTYRRKLKSFIYLTDVLALSDGPYTYVAGACSAYIKLNRTLSAALPNHTETPLVNWGNIIPVLAKKGSLVISDQSGAHRGLPQLATSLRRLAVMSYDRPARVEL